MKNSKVKKFETKMNAELTIQKDRLINRTNEHLAAFTTSDFTLFNNDQPYTGSLKNKVFFTYCDHYRGNSGTWMEVARLGNAHQNMDDRGYIRGAVTDLEGYLTLQSANSLNHNFDCVAPIYIPKFRSSKHKDTYVNLCNKIIVKITSELNEFILSQKMILNARLKELTGCSLLHYLRSI